MSVVISVEDIGPCRKELKVEVPAPAVEAETRRVIDEVSRKVQIPGFRKGKVPRQVVERRFRQEIEQDVLERLLPRYWRQAEAESGLRPLLEPRFRSEDFQADAPLIFYVAVEVRPEIQVGDLDGLDLPPAEVELTDDEVSGELEDLRRSRAKLNAVERAAVQDDVVSVQLQELPAAAEGEEAPALPEPQKVQVEIGGEQVWEELSVALTGLSAGQEAEFSHRMGSGDDAIVRRFRVHVDQVQERDLPPLDDAFAATVGKFETLDALREAIRTHLLHDKQTRHRRERERILLDQLRQRYPSQLPGWVVEEQIKSLLTDFAEHVSRQGVDLDTIDWQEMGERMRPQAEARVHADLLLDAIAEARSIRITEQEFEFMLSSIARHEKSSTMAVRQALDRAGRLTALRVDMTRQKTVRHLLGEDEAGAEAEEEEHSAE